MSETKTSPVKPKRCPRLRNMGRLSKVGVVRDPQLQKLPPTDQHGFAGRGQRGTHMSHLGM
jgi:hypothetical protein